MKLNSIGVKTTPAFGRAFTTQEENKWKQIQANAKKALGLNDTFMICFDSCMPEAQGKDKGIGSSFSAAAKDFTDFATRKFGITGVQYAPQGRLAQFIEADGEKEINASPFSSTAFALGEHLIDLEQLTSEEFAKILPENVYQQTISKYNSPIVDYSKVPPSQGAIDDAVNVAFENFKNLPKKSPLRAEYNNFVKENGDWLEKEALYDCLEQKYGSGKSWREWDEPDKNLFDAKHNPKARVAQIKSQYQETFDKTFFVQFILDKQQESTHQAYNKQGQKLVGDCLIGFSGKEEWANREAFLPEQVLGCAPSKDKKDDPEELNRCCWGIPALDLSKLGTPDNLGPAGKLLARKMEINFQRYDALRIDAAWQLIQPFLYKADDKNPKQMLPVDPQPKSYGDAALKIIDSVLKKTRPNDYKSYPVNLELLGGPIKFQDPIVEDRMQIQHSVYQKKTYRDSKDVEGNPIKKESFWGFANYYKNGLKNGADAFTFGLGTHDDETLIAIAKDASRRKEQAHALSQNLGVSENRLSDDEAWFRDAKFAEIFTTKNNFFTVFDAMGMDKRINTQNSKDKENWGARVPVNYEEAYHRNAVHGFGLNLPHAYLTALKVQGCEDQELLSSLQKAGDVLREDTGSMYTQRDANSGLGQDFSAIG